MPCVRSINILVLLSVISFSTFADPVNIAASQSFEPYVIDNQGALEGIDIELGEEMYRRLQLSYDYQSMPWARQLQYAEKGLVGGILTVYCNDKRAFLEVSSEHFYSVKISLFTHSSNSNRANIKSLEDLPKNTRVGIVRDNYFSTLLSKDRGVEKVLTHSTPLLIPQLALGRIDFAIEEYAPFKYYAKKEGREFDLVEVLEVKKDKICTAFSKAYWGEQKSAELVNRASAVIKAMRTEGFIQSIIDKYL